MTNNFDTIIVEKQCNFTDGTRKHLYNEKEHRRLHSVLLQKTFQYCDEYGSFPKYAKIPAWLQKALDFYRNAPTDTMENLILCPTQSIHEIDEIEVF